MLGAQDYEVAALCAGLIYLGDESAARTCLNDYLSSKRRDLIPYPPVLSEICEMLIDSHETRAAWMNTAISI